MGGEAGTGRIYLDANVWITWIGRDRGGARRDESARRLVESLENGRQVALFTTLVRQEVAHRLTREIELGNPGRVHDREWIASELKRLLDDPIVGMINDGRVKRVQELVGSGLKERLGAPGRHFVGNRLRTPRGDMHYLSYWMPDKIERLFGEPMRVYKCPKCGRKKARERDPCPGDPGHGRSSRGYLGHRGLEVNDLCHAYLAKFYGADAFYTFDRAFLNLDRHPRFSLKCMVWNYGR